MEDKNAHMFLRGGHAKNTNGSKRQSINRRESNLELFRILSMLLIVAHHYVVNSGLMSVVYEDPTEKRSIFMLL